jgi:hypothetical protein
MVTSSSRMRLRVTSCAYTALRLWPRASRRGGTARHRRAAPRGDGARCRRSRRSGRPGRRVDAVELEQRGGPSRSLNRLALGPAYEDPGGRPSPQARPHQQVSGAGVRPRRSRPPRGRASRSRRSAVRCRFGCNVKRGGAAGAERRRGSFGRDLHRDRSTAGARAAAFDSGAGPLERAGRRGAPPRRGSPRRRRPPRAGQTAHTARASSCIARRPYVPGADRPSSGPIRRGSAHRTLRLSCRCIPFVKCLVSRSKPTIRHRPRRPSAGETWNESQGPTSTSLHATGASPAAARHRGVRLRDRHRPGPAHPPLGRATPRRPRAAPPRTDPVIRTRRDPSCRWGAGRRSGSSP